ncbi:uncharacterized protein LOC121875193 [Homarus americanus]|uniref:uncharacterized protein LOC121875193 n=1 Tax=Homarus americanus TaxID=6706 RepID=UPI001C4677BF|nr:uncharacterized protein LOC121875193 [Homarus americanus]
MLEKRVLEDQQLEDELADLEEMPHPRLVKDRQRLKKVTENTYPTKHKSGVEPPSLSEGLPAPNPHLVHQDSNPSSQESLHHFSGEEGGKHHATGDVASQHSMTGVLHNTQGDTHHNTQGDTHHNTPQESHHVTESTFDQTTMPFAWTESSEIDFEPTVGTERNPGMEVVQEPVVLPVTEGKNRGQEPIVHYGLPKELLPIHPGGGSRFDDLEREKLERAKMAQTKADEEDTDNGTSHDAEGLYSSAASLCFSSLIFSFSYLRILI